MHFSPFRPPGLLFFSGAMPRSNRSARERSPSISFDSSVETNFGSPRSSRGINDGDPEEGNVAVTRFSSPRALSAARTIRKRTREPEETLHVLLRAQKPLHLARPPLFPLRFLVISTNAGLFIVEVTRDSRA